MVSSDSVLQLWHPIFLLCSVTMTSKLATMLRACLAALLLLVASTLAPQPNLTEMQSLHYFAMKDYLTRAHQHIPNAQQVEYYPHLIAAHPDLESDAWEHAKSSCPIFITWDGQEKNAFVTSKIPSNSDLGRRWGLIFQERPVDAFALWHLRKGQKKLLRLDIWPVGGNVAERQPLRRLLERMKIP